MMWVNQWWSSEREREKRKSWEKIHSLFGSKLEEKKIRWEGDVTDEQTPWSIKDIREREGVVWGRGSGRVGV